MSFFDFEAWIVAVKKVLECVAVTAQSRSNLDFQSASQSLVIRLPSLGYELGLKVFLVFSGLENPCFGNLENPVANSRTLVLRIKTSRSSSSEFRHVTS